MKTVQLAIAQEANAAEEKQQLAVMEMLQVMLIRIRTLHLTHCMRGPGGGAARVGYARCRSGMGFRPDTLIARPDGPGY